MDINIININDWMGPLMALGAIALGALLLVGDYLQNKDK